MRIMFYLIVSILVFSKVGNCMQTKAFMKPLKQRKLVLRKQRLPKISPKEKQVPMKKPTFSVPKRNQPELFKKPDLFIKRPDLFQKPDTLFKKPDTLFQSPELFKKPDDLFKVQNFFRT